MSNSLPTPVKDTFRSIPWFKIRNLVFYLEINKRIKQIICKKESRNMDHYHGTFESRVISHLAGGPG